jgi:hypothetical protein
MKQLMRLFVSLLVPALMLAFATGAPAMKHEEKAKDAKAAKAEKGQATRKGLLENDKVTVFEVRFKPGDENKAVPSSSYRVVKAIKGGTLKRTYADGKTQDVQWKTGEVRMVEPEKTAYTVKNVGKGDVELYVVVLKQAK